MATVRAQRQIRPTDDGFDRNGSVGMRKELTASGGLPLQGFAQFRGIDGEQHQIGLTGAMLGGAFDDLCGGGEVDETIGRVLGGARVASAGLRILPFLAAAHMVDKGFGHEGTLTQAMGLEQVKSV